jgi:hypothetical protein
MKIASLVRAPVGALALTLLAGCSGTASFTIDETYEINGVGPVDSTKTLSLSQIAGDAWDQRKRIKDAKITGATGFIRKVYTTPDPNDAQTASGTSTLSRGGQTVTVASGTDIPIAVNTWLSASDLDGTASMIKDALKGDGILDLTTSAAPAPGGSRVHIDVQVIIDVEVEWSVF